ncbi:TPM domain-containing protein [Alcaligenes aquatilis]|uniref:TPM domain-containing protein n=1 Tax=Alcaligenes aquatilis TaxID=323284 RepID=UPI003616CC3A
MSVNWKELSGWASVHGQWLRRRYFNAEMLGHLAEQIRKGEEDHSGELVVAIEAVLPAHEADSAQRALEVFGRLRVWDTPLNSGVLLYLALGQRRIHIIADRGIQADPVQWAQICRQLEKDLASREYLSGLLGAVSAIEAVLQKGAPTQTPGAAGNALPDEPVLL